MNDSWEWALNYMELGWSVFPVDGKVPCTRNGVKDASRDVRHARIWYKHFPERGIALATGAPSGVWALDIDDALGIEDLNALPETVFSVTSKGWHFLFNMPTFDVRNSVSKIADGVDVRGTGGYIVLPPSPHPDGGKYKWINSPWSYDVADPPAWLLEALQDTGNGGGSTGPAGEVPDTIPQGQRNDALTSIAGTLRRRGLTKEEIVDCLKVLNRSRCNPMLPDGEIVDIASSIQRYEPTEPFVVRDTHTREITVASPEV